MILYYTMNYNFFVLYYTMHSHKIMSYIFNSIFSILIIFVANKPKI